jgi:hypothetical protein
VKLTEKSENNYIFVTSEICLRLLFEFLVVNVYAYFEVLEFSLGALM